MSARVVILGGGHGVSAVVRALREEPVAITAIVSVADDGGSSGALRRRWGGPAVGDIRRSLIALAGEDEGSGRALAAPVTIARVGRHPLGNLLLHSLAKAFGDLEAASEWLTGQFGVSAHVLPATTEPVILTATAGHETIRGESAIGAAPTRLTRLGFDPPRPEVPAPVIDTIAHADWVVIGPGSLFTSVLAVSALPDIRSVLARTGAYVLWICNLEPEIPETARMSAADHLATLRSHDVRLDAVLYDPAARLHFTAGELAAAHLDGLAHPLVGADPGRHDPMLLSAALRPLLTGGAAGQRVSPVHPLNNSRK